MIITAEVKDLQTEGTPCGESLIPPRMPYSTLEDFYAARYCDSAAYECWVSVTSAEAESPLSINGFDPLSYAHVVRFVEEYEKAKDTTVHPASTILDRVENVVTYTKYYSKDEKSRAEFNLRARELKFEYLLIVGKDLEAWRYLQKELKDSEYYKYSSITGIIASINSLLTREPSLNGVSNIRGARQQNIDSVLTLVDLAYLMLMEQQQSNPNNTLRHVELEEFIELNVATSNVPPHTLMSLRRLATTGFVPLTHELHPHKVEVSKSDSNASSEYVGDTTVGDVAEVSHWILNCDDLSSMMIRFKQFKQALELAQERIDLHYSAQEYVRTKGTTRLIWIYIDTGKNLVKDIEKFFKKARSSYLFSENQPDTSIDLDLTATLYAVTSCLDSSEKSVETAIFRRFNELFGSD